MRIAPHDVPFLLAKIDAFRLNYGLLKELDKKGVLGGLGVRLACLC